MPGPKQEHCGVCYYEEDGYCLFNPPPNPEVKDKYWCGRFIDFFLKKEEEEN